MDTIISLKSSSEMIHNNFRLEYPGTSDPAPAWCGWRDPMKAITRSENHIRYGTDFSLDKV